jgi:Protein of unknown function (DUF3631)/Bifunctional DNA primase/polymerase, N-terminal
MATEQVLADLYSLLREAVLLPIPLGKKGPVIAGWQRLTFKDTQTAGYQRELRKAIQRSGNIGVSLGLVSGRLFSIDIDSAELVEQYCKRTPWLSETLATHAKRGGQFWFRLEEDCDYPEGNAVETVKVSDGSKIELRFGGGKGAQSVIFGVHPDGPLYEILKAVPPTVIGLADLYELCGWAPEDAASRAPDKREQSASAASGKVSDRRISAYIAKVPPSIEGQRGDDQLFKVACILVIGWNLSPEAALPYLIEYNTRSEPPWPESRLKYKLAEADKQPGPRGLLLHKALSVDGFLTKALPPSQSLPCEPGCEEESQERPRESGVLALRARQEAQREAPGGEDFMGDPVPWPEPVTAEALFGEIAACIKNHLVINEHYVCAITLWIVMTWCTDVVDTLPVLAISSPEKRCGKTRLLSVLKRLVRNPLATSNISSAALYRAIEKWKPTLLVDEFDSFGKNNEDLRNVINSGHTRDSTDLAIRCHPSTHEPERFSTYASKAIGLIGKLHTTTGDRSIHVEMERKKKTEPVLPLRRTAPEEWQDLRRKILRWVIDHKDEITKTEPDLPNSINDRAADNWFPLLAIGQVAGWKDKAMEALVVLNPAEDDDDSVVITFLCAVRAVFDERLAAHKTSHQSGTDSGDDFLLSTTDIVGALNKDKEAPWADSRNGQGLSEKKAASYLRRFRIKSIQKQIKGVRVRGYTFGKLRRIFETYLPPRSMESNDD